MLDYHRVSDFITFGRYSPCPDFDISNPQDLDYWAPLLLHTLDQGDLDPLVSQHLNTCTTHLGVGNLTATDRIATLFSHPALDIGTGDLHAQGFVNDQGQNTYNFYS